MQTEAPRPDGGLGWPGLRLRPDIVDTEDAFAKYPYTRESRRIQAEFTVVEQHIGADHLRNARSDFEQRLERRGAPPIPPGVKRRHQEELHKRMHQARCFLTISTTCLERFSRCCARSIRMTSGI